MGAPPPIRAPLIHSGVSPLTPPPPSGNGMSSRPKFTVRGLRETEEFHVQCIEEWRRAMGMEKMTLLGHSFGGYMAACYALKCVGGGGGWVDEWLGGG